MEGKESKDMLAFPIREEVNFGKDQFGLARTTPNKLPPANHPFGTQQGRFSKEFTVNFVNSAILKRDEVGTIELPRLVYGIDFYVNEDERFPRAPITVTVRLAWEDELDGTVPNTYGDFEDHIFHFGGKLMFY